MASCIACVVLASVAGMVMWSAAKRREYRQKVTEWKKRLPDVDSFFVELDRFNSLHSTVSGLDRPGGAPTEAQDVSDYRSALDVFRVKWTPLCACAGVKLVPRREEVRGKSDELVLLHARFDLLLEHPSNVVPLLEALTNVVVDTESSNGKRSRARRALSAFVAATENMVLELARVGDVKRLARFFLGESDSVVGSLGERGKNLHDRLSLYRSFNSVRPDALQSFAEFKETLRSEVVQDGRFTLSEERLKRALSIFDSYADLARRRRDVHPMVALMVDELDRAVSMLRVQDEYHSSEPDHQGEPTAGGIAMADEELTAMAAPGAQSIIIVTVLDALSEARKTLERAGREQIQTGPAEQRSE